MCRSQRPSLGERSGTMAHTGMSLVCLTGLHVVYQITAAGRVEYVGDVGVGTRIIAVGLTTYVSVITTRALQAFPLLKLVLITHLHTCHRSYRACR